MSDNYINDKEIQQKEAELESVIQEYYRYNMKDLKAEISRLLENETMQIDEDKRVKLEDIRRKFAKLNALGSDHVNRGSRHKSAIKGDEDSVASDEKLLENFEKFSLQYEDQVKSANTEKQEIREEITKLEDALRRQRDLCADKQTDNKNLEFLLQREAELAEDKAQKEDAALKMLNDDLAFQLGAIQKNQDMTEGVITPLRMETLLRDQFKQTVDGYKQFVTDSANELEEEEQMLRVMTSALQKERQTTEVLQIEKRKNDEELKTLTVDFNALQKQLDDLNFAFDNKQMELDHLRQQAGDDARRLSVELCAAQKETNVLVLEVKKYEGLHRFMDLERGLITKAIADAKGLNPGISSQDIEEAENRQAELEGQIRIITSEWDSHLRQVRDQVEQTMSETEVKEFQTRISRLQQELTEKTQEIEYIGKEKNKIQDVIDQTMDQDIDLMDQTEEIDELNKNYRRALNDKVTVYDELRKAVEMLASRNAEFMNNEIELTKLNNLTSITKKELEQKEKISMELKDSLDNHEESAKIAAQSDDQIAEKQAKIENLSKDLYEKDKMIEQLNALLRKRESQKQKMQMELGEKDRDFGISEEDRVKRQKFAPSQIRQGRGRGGDDDFDGPEERKGAAQNQIKPRVNHKFERGDYAAQGIDPRTDMLDARIQQDLVSISLPFPFQKFSPDAEEGGAWYVLGTKAVLVREYDEDVLMLREYKGYSDEHFRAYVQAQTEAEWKHIQMLLQTTFQHLLKEEDPVQALSDHFVKLYQKEFNQ